MTREPLPLFRWLRPALLALACAAGVYGMWRFFVATLRGQRLDTLAYFGANIGSWAVSERANALLERAVSVSAIAVVMVLVALTAVLRRRWLLALEAATLVAAANLTTQVLKYHVLYRPVLVGIGGLDNNSFPSGHTTAAASAMVAALLVAPRRLRVAVALLGSVVMMAFGWATLAAHWHRPSDVVGGYLVCLGWAFAALFVQAARQALVGRGRHETPDVRRPSRLWPALMLVAAGVALAVAAWCGYHVWNITQPGNASPHNNFLGYLGGSAGICGVAAAGMAVLLRLVQLQDARTAELI